MAVLKLPVHIDGFECVEDMANAVLDYSYKGRTLKEWADSISNPVTNGDRFRAMADEELAEWLDQIDGIGMFPGQTQWLDWLRQEANHND